MWMLWVACLVAVLPSPSAPQQQGNWSRYNQECDISDLSLGDCGDFLRCMKQSEFSPARCVCMNGYNYTNNVCTRIPDPTTTTEEPSISPDANTPRSAESGPDNSNKSSFVSKFLIIPACLVLIGAVVYYGARHYKIVQRFRQIRQNRYGSVLVTRDDTDEDDAPQLA